MTTPLVFGLGGRLRAGKDAVADYLVDRHGFVKLGMSDPLLEHALILDPWIPVNVRAAGAHGEEGLFVRLSTLVEEVGYVEAKKNPEVRRFMQADGTEGGREFHHDNVWVDRATRTIEEHLSAGRGRVVLTGLRFLNELAIPRAFGGRALWVERPGLDSDTPSAAHASENSVNGTLFDHTIVNDGSLEDLYRRVDDYMEALQA